jgi:hypothetical protein
MQVPVPLLILLPLVRPLLPPPLPLLTLLPLLPPLQDRASQMAALVAAVLADPVCPDSLKRLATVVQCAHPDHH